MKAEQINKIRKELERLAEEGREICQTELDKWPMKDELTLNTVKLAYRMYISGINRTTKIFCEELGLDYKPIKKYEKINFGDKN